jgi:cobalt-zinc-cadmium efflux system protein
MASHHDHSHTDHFNTHNRSFAIAVILNLAFVVIEAVYGMLSGSLALLADAGHNLSDVMGQNMQLAGWPARGPLTAKPMA